MHSAFAHGSSPISGMARHTSGFVRHCARVRPPLPSPSPTLRTAARDTVPQRRGLFSGAARTLPGSSRRANDILYIRVRRRESEHVLHRAASNDVDNFSVDNPLWITAAAKCRLLRGGRGRRCGGSVNAGTKMQTRTGRVRKSSRAMGARRGRLSAPWPRFHGMDRADVYINTRARVLLRRMCVKPAALTTHSPPKTFARPRTATHPSRALPIVHATPTHARRLCDARPADLTTHSRRRPSLTPAQRHALPEHFRSPTQPRRTPAGCAMHSPPTSPPIPRQSSSLTPAQRHALPEHFRSPTQPRRTPAGCAMPSPPTSQPIPRRKPSPAPAQRHALAEHFRSPTQRRCTPAGCAIHSPLPSPPIPRSATLPPLPFRFGHKKTAPHSGCAMPNVSVDRRCGRSLGLVSRALFAAVAGRWRVGVGLRPQPWALRSRRCGRVLRA